MSCGRHLVPYPIHNICQTGSNTNRSAVTAGKTVISFLKFLTTLYPAPCFPVGQRRYKSGMALKYGLQCCLRPIAVPWPRCQEPDPDARVPFLHIGYTSTDRRGAPTAIQDTWCVLSCAAQCSLVKKPRKSLCAQYLHQRELRCYMAFLLATGSYSHSGLLLVLVKSPASLPSLSVDGFFHATVGGGEGRRTTTASRVRCRVFVLRAAGPKVRRHHAAKPSPTRTRAVRSAH